MLYINYIKLIKCDLNNINIMGLNNIKYIRLNTNNDANNITSLRGNVNINEIKLDKNAYGNAYNVNECIKIYNDNRVINYMLNNTVKCESETEGKVNMNLIILEYEFLLGCEIYLKLNEYELITLEQVITIELEKEQEYNKIRLVYKDKFFEKNFRINISNISLNNINNNNKLSFNINDVNEYNFIKIDKINEYNVNNIYVNILMNINCFGFYLDNININKIINDHNNTSNMNVYDINKHINNINKDKRNVSIIKDALQLNIKIWYDKDYCNDKIIFKNDRNDYIIKYINIYIY